MKSITNVDTTITVELTPQDVIEYVTKNKLAPPVWEFYSVEVTGQGVSKGATLIIRHSIVINPREMGKI